MPVANDTTNEDGLADPVANARFPLMVSVYIPAFLISEIGNGFVVYSLAYLKRRRRTAIDNYVLNLAIADFIITTMSLFNAFEYMNNEWKLGEAMCKIHGQTVEAMYTVSTFTLLAVSYNRSKAVNDRLKILNARRALKRKIALIWIAAFVLSSPLAYAYTVAKRNGNFHCSNTNFDKLSRSIYYLLQAVALFFVPVAIMIVSQRKITRGLRQHSQIYRASMDCKNAHWKRVMTDEKRVGRFLTWIWVVFVCCFMPHITLRTIDHFTSLRRNEIFNQIWHVSQLVALLNSAINPFLYYRTTNRDGAKASRVVKLFCCIRQGNKREVACSQASTTSSKESHVMSQLTSKK
jgi:hypothetical protein